jgi:hypothetical protein
MNGQLHAPAALPLAKQPPAPQAGWALEPVWKLGVEKNLQPLPVIET